MNVASAMEGCDRVSQRSHTRPNGLAGLAIPVASATGPLRSDPSGAVVVGAAWCGSGLPIPGPVGSIPTASTDATISENAYL